MSKLKRVKELEAIEKLIFWQENQIRMLELENDLLRRELQDTRERHLQPALLSQQSDLAG